MKKGNGELLYCATPSKIAHKTKKIIEEVSKKGYAPFHPFQAFPYEYFEGNPNIGRDKAMEYCLRGVEMCDIFGLFGISKGTSLIELPYALELKKPIIICKEFDEKWEEYLKELTTKTNNLNKIIISLEQTQD